MLIAAVIALCATKPALDHRWVYVQTNLQVAANADNLCELIARSKKAGYNGIVLADSKMQRLADVPEHYFTNARKVVAEAKKEGIEIVPAVWPVGYASSMLWHDVNLIEGLPVKKARFVVRGSEAVPLDGGDNLLTNGNLERSEGDKVAGLSFQDGVGVSTHVDRSTKHEGSSSVRQDNFKAGNESGNARIVWAPKLQPFHQYILSGWTKCDGLKGMVQAMALDGKGRGLVINELPGEPTQPWTHFSFSFNSLDSPDIHVYAGVWGGSAGTIWWDDLAVTDADLLNVVRRPGCPLTVTHNGSALVEGKDFQKVADPGLGVKPWNGEYDADHSAPSIKLIGNNLKDGDELEVSFFHAKTGIGNQASICLSEPKTLDIMADEAKRVSELFHPKGLFWSHDEIRIGGWCDACMNRKLTPGQILAQNARDCDRIQQNLMPGSATYVWSDMFDPAHNAVDKYYLTNGSLAGSWEGLPKNAVIVNWNSGAQSKSLSFFAGRGHRQILAGYYDGPVESIKPWMAEASKSGKLAGVMYTTWVGDYSHLEDFAKAAWGE